MLIIVQNISLYNIDCESATECSFQVAYNTDCESAAVCSFQVAFSAENVKILCVANVDDL